MATDMLKALRQAALLRNLIEGALKATLDPMTGRELADMSAIKEQIGTSGPGYGRLSTQLQQMVKKKLLEKMGGGMNTTYRWIRATDEKVASLVPAPAPVPVPTAAPVPVPAPLTALPELNIKLDKTKPVLKFEFGGYVISIEIVG